MAEIILQNPAALLALPVIWILFLTFGWRRRFKPLSAFLLRLAIVVLAVLALARPVHLPPGVAARNEDAQRLVILVDQSASLDDAQRQILRAEAVRLAGEAEESDILYFADQAVVIPPGTDDAQSTPLNPEITNLAEALLAGAGLLNNRSGRLLLMSDGLATAGDAVRAARRLAQQETPVDVLTLEEAPEEDRREVRLVTLAVPSSLRQNEAVTVELSVHSLRATEATLNLTQDGTVLAQDVVNLEPGVNVFAFDTNVMEVGPHTFRAAVAPAAGQDEQPVNNSLSAFIQVYPSPQLLVVGSEPDKTARFSSYLQEAGFDPQRIQPADVPTRLSELEPYAGMVLLDVSARTLQLEQMVAIQEFVRSLGRGLVVAGGRSSFSLGGYEDTPLAKLLPVSLEPPPREERPPVVLLLLIDHSGSMMERRETTKLVMAKEAAIRATDILGPEDRIGVLIFDDQYEWIVPFQPVSDGAELLEIQRLIATIPGGGGTHILEALEEALPALAGQEMAGGARHAVLLTDGRSFDGLRGIEDYDRLIDAALEANITLSTIAIGAGADENLLTHLAERGLGRYHFAAVPEELPALTIAESAILSSDIVQEGDFRPAVSGPHPILRSLLSRNVPVPGEELPDVHGYVALTPKPRAEIVLQVGPGDPLLSVWGYGLGRVVAWSSDTGQEWTAEWPSWSELTRFWGQVVDYTLPDPGLGLLQLQAEVEVNDGVVTIMADGVTATGQTVDLVPTQATLVTPAGRVTEFNLVQIAPGRYQQRLRLPDPGAYELTVVQERAGEEPDEAATIGFVVPYPAEYGLPAEGAGEPLLRQIADLTGGRMLSPGHSLADATATGSVESSPQRRLELWPGLLLAALVLWPIEIAWRRWSRLRIQ